MLLHDSVNINLLIYLEVFVHNVAQAAVNKNAIQTHIGMKSCNKLITNWNQQKNVNSSYPDLVRFDSWNLLWLEIKNKV